MGFETVAHKKQPHKRPRHSGEFHWNARLTSLDVQDIIRRADKGEAYTAIAASFGVSSVHISRIHRKEQRKHG